MRVKRIQRDKIMEKKYLEHLRSWSLLADILLIVSFPIIHIYMVIRLLTTKSDEKVDSFKEANLVSLKACWFALIDVL